MKYLSIILLCLVFACKLTPSEPTKVEENKKYYGQEITSDNALNLGTMITQLEGKDSIKVKVKGRIESVCQVKGCWMNLVQDNVESEELFVKFKDYAYFMPLDATGKEVIVEGWAYREITSVDELRHYAEDEGKSKEEIEKITEPTEELKFMADGVILLL